jgi:hypothetical protein
VLVAFRFTRGSSIGVDGNTRGRNIEEIESALKLTAKSGGAINSVSMSLNIVSEMQLDGDP